MATPPPNGKLQKCHNNNPPPIMMQTLIAFIPYPFLTYGAIPIPNVSNQFRAYPKEQALFSAYLY